MSRTPEQIMGLAWDASFYRDENGDMFRMNYTDPEEQRFEVLDEDTGEEFWVAAEEVTDSCRFYRLVDVELNDNGVALLAMAVESLQEYCADKNGDMNDSLAGRITEHLHKAIE